MPDPDSTPPGRSLEPASPSTDDPTALAEYGRLDLVARLVVEGDMLGQHKSPMKGASVEFTEHRQYHPGDEIRHIDWRAYGKTGKYFVKEFEDETSLRCQLLVDASGNTIDTGANALVASHETITLGTLGGPSAAGLGVAGYETFIDEIRLY